MDLRLKTDHKFEIGDRARIDDKRFPGYWANGVTGIVGKLPFAESHIDMVETASGPQPFYWVEFDEPRDDDEDDGPCCNAWVICHALWPVDAR